MGSRIFVLLSFLPHLTSTSKGQTLLAGPSGTQSFWENEAKHHLSAETKKCLGDRRGKARPGCSLPHDLITSPRSVMASPSWFAWARPSLLVRTVVSEAPRGEEPPMASFPKRPELSLKVTSQIPCATCL